MYKVGTCMIPTYASLSRPRCQRPAGRHKEIRLAPSARLVRCGRVLVVGWWIVVPAAWHRLPGWHLHPGVDATTPDRETSQQEAIPHNALNSLF